MIICESPFLVRGTEYGARRCKADTRVGLGKSGHLWQTAKECGRSPLTDDVRFRTPAVWGVDTGIEQSGVRVRCARDHQRVAVSGLALAAAQLRSRDWRALSTAEAFGVFRFDLDPPNARVLARRRRCRRAHLRCQRRD